jgi:CRP-like cAMP-binding protein
MIDAGVGDPEESPIDFLSALTPDELAAFRASGRLRRYAKGERIFHEGDDPGGVVAIVSGQVRVSVMGVGGREVLLRFSTPGELVGEVAAIAGGPRMATVTAVGSVEAIAMRPADFQRFVADHPRLTPLVFERMAALLANANRQLVDFATRDVTARIARRLLELAQQGGQQDETGVRITLPLSQDELASWTGASREAVSRSLHLLRELGWVETGRRELKVVNIEGLRSLV